MKTNSLLSGPVLVACVCLGCLSIAGCDDKKSGDSGDAADPATTDTGMPSDTGQGTHPTDTGTGSGSDSRPTDDLETTDRDTDTGEARATDSVGQTDSDSGQHPETDSDSVGSTAGTESDTGSDSGHPVPDPFDAHVTNHGISGCGGWEEMDWDGGPEPDAGPVNPDAGDAGDPEYMDAGPIIFTGTLTNIDPDDYANLSCISWKMDRAFLNVDAIHRVSNCRPYNEIRVAEGWDAQVTVYHYQQELFACTCCFDLAYQAFPLEGVDLTLCEVELDYSGGSQPQQPLACDRVTSIPVTTQPEGVSCEYIGSGGNDCFDPLKPFFPCDESPDTCPDDLVCTDVAGVSVPLCLKSCTDDSACLPTGITSCQDGFCKLK